MSHRARAVLPMIERGHSGAAGPRLGKWAVWGAMAQAEGIAARALAMAWF